MPSTDQTLTPVDGDWLRLAATVQDSQRLYWWILGFGDQIIVDAPTELRQQIADNVARMAQNYASPGNI